MCALIGGNWVLLTDVDPLKLILVRESLHLKKINIEISQKSSQTGVLYMYYHHLLPLVTTIIWPGSHHLPII